MMVVLKSLKKSFAPREGEKDSPPALTGVSLEVGEGELVVLVGPSGCGKSTTLRMVAGLDEPDSGDVFVGGRSMRGVAPQDRDVAMVFQGYALYPHMTVRENLEFPLKMRGIRKGERGAMAEDAARMLRIEGLLGRLPKELSGGERQRVAMGRALVRKPRVFLFDEPLSNLDAALRADLRLEIGSLVRRLGATALYVTHDHVEAMTLADRIAVMQAGKLLQFAPPREVYEHPATSFVATFLGSPRMNLLEARVEGDEVLAGPFRLPRPRFSVPDRLQVGVRPEDLTLQETGAAGVLEAVEPLGAESHLVVRVADVVLRLRVAGFASWRRGDAVNVALDLGKLHWFGENGTNLDLSERR